MNVINNPLFIQQNQNIMYLFNYILELNDKLTMKIRDIYEEEPQIEVSFTILEG